MKNVIALLATLLMAQSVFAGPNQGPIVYKGHCLHYSVKQAKKIDVNVELQPSSESHVDPNSMTKVFSEDGLDYLIGAEKLEDPDKFNYVLAVAIAHTGQPLPQGFAAMAMGYFNEGKTPESLAVGGGTEANFETMTCYATP